jgi:hypothetical protein
MLYSLGQEHPNDRAGERRQLPVDRRLRYCALLLNPDFLLPSSKIPWIKCHIAHYKSKATATGGGETTGRNNNIFNLIKRKRGTVTTEHHYPIGTRH